ncbi:MAG: hypothetical protein NT029_18070 [Armatimonadetes bacterium]|nr:hypothetical protein [Armatimonadota bacterium]
MAPSQSEPGSVALAHGGIRLEADRAAACITTLGWDTEGTGREGVNLLKSPVELRMWKAGAPVAAASHLAASSEQGVRYELSVGEAGRLAWEVDAHSDGLRMAVSCAADVSRSIDKLELVFPFEPTRVMTSVISSHGTDDGRFQLPAIISAPDLGQMLATSPSRAGMTGRVEGSRPGKWLVVTLELPVPAQGARTELRIAPVVLPRPAGYRDAKRWRAARRGWFNLIQQSCGASGGGVEVHGVWANNALSDPVSSVLYMLVDATLLVPDLAPGVSMAPILRRSVDYWLDHKTAPDGLVAYTAGGTGQNVMDANPAVLIGAWGAVQATGDLGWLRGRISRLEFISRYLEQRDIDGDGLVESKQSGNSGSRPPRDPDCAWDCYVGGHKNAYVNALAYRAWMGMADLERRLDRGEEAQRYEALTAGLKEAFLPAFLNPETGWLGFWRSRDGALHDLHMDAPTSIAVSYGLIEKEKGREMLHAYWKALMATGFSRFDLGVPLNLRPVPRAEMEHYTEFQHFLNGGCGVSNTSYLLNALYQVGMRREADMILDAMLKRQADGAFPNGGGFQNGFVDQMGGGAEVVDWNGKPEGYEGHLVYCWAFLHSMLMREPAMREKALGPGAHATGWGGKK